MQSHLHMKHVNSQEVTHSLISDFFPIWIRGKTINFKAALKSELPGKTNSTSCACELPFATPFKSRCAVLWRAEPDTSHYCPAFETNPNWHSLSYHIRLNLLITCSCHFTVKSVRLGWSYPPLTLTPSWHFSPRGWKNTPNLSLTPWWRHWTLTLLGLSLWGSNTLSQRRRPVSCLSCCR